MKHLHTRLDVLVDRPQPLRVRPESLGSPDPSSVVSMMYFGIGSPSLVNRQNVRIERNAPKRRLRRFLPGRRGESTPDIALLPDARFAAPEIDPFTPRYDDFEGPRGRSTHSRSSSRPTGSRPASRRRSGCRGRARAWPRGAIRAAIGRYCAKKVAALDLELGRVYRHGFFALLGGFLAVIV